MPRAISGGRRWRVPRDLNCLGLAERDLGNSEATRSCFEESVAPYSVLQDVHDLDSALAALGELTRDAELPEWTAREIFDLDLHA